MKKYLIAGAAVAALIAGGTAIAQVQPQIPAPARHHIMADKTMTRAEVAAHAQKMFARFDASRDGFITQAEIGAGKAQADQRVEQRPNGRDPARMFDRLDANHDGQVTRPEADAAHQARAQRRADAANRHMGFFDRVDANKDGVVTRAEFDAMAGQMHGRMDHAGMKRGFGGRMFGMADANKDGRVSLAEAQAAALAHFDRADTNHDGTLTPQERQQAHQLMRDHRPS